MSKQATELLARFPGPVTLHRSVTKWIWVFIGCAAFTAGFIAMVTHPDASRGSPLMEWFGLAFFGAGAIIAAVMLMPGSGSLTLDRNGFRIRSLFRSDEHQWADASNFTVYDATFGQSFGRMQSVAYTSTASGQSGLTGALSYISRQLIDGDTALPETYGMEASELALLMEGWRARALTEPARTSVGARAGSSAPAQAFGQRQAPVFGRRNST